MGVTSSPSPSPRRQGASESNARAAGTGTGIFPWDDHASPDPPGRAEQKAPGAPRCSKRKQAETMSTIASVAPTSWKCTFSFEVPWTFASATASFSKHRTARSLVPAGRFARRRRERISGRCLEDVFRAESLTLTRVPAIPEEDARSTEREYPRTGRPRNARRSSFSAPVKERSAAHAMSPAMPEKQSKKRTLFMTPA